MKKCLFIILAVIFLFTTNSALAVAQNITKTMEKLEKASSVAATKNDAQLERARTSANRIIDNRINSLNNLLSRISNDKRLIAADKTSLTNDVQSTITALNQLKTKIAADTTVEEVRTDTKSIVTNYKVFAVFEPKMRLLTTISDLQSLTNQYLELASFAQKLLDLLKAQGKNVSSAQTILTDIKTRLDTINTKLAANKTKILAITVTSTDAKTTFVTVRQDLASVRADFAKIRNDVAQIRADFRKTLQLKGIISPTTTIVKPSTIPTTTP